MQRAISSKLTFASFSLVKALNKTYNWTIRNIKINHLLIFLFAYTAFSKLNPFTYTAPFDWSTFKTVDISEFKGAMFKSLVLRPYVNTLAYLIPSVEIAVCLLLLFNKTKKIGYYSSLLLLLAFTGYILFILYRYKGHLPCTCGGVISLLTWKQHLIFNTTFLALCVRAIYLLRKNKENAL